MIYFGVNVVIGVVLASYSGFFGLGTLIAGFTLGYGVMWAALRAAGVRTRYFRVMWRVFRLGVFFVYELIVSSVAVIWDVLTPQHLSQPAILEMPLDVKSDEEILLVTNLISLTPGTLSLDVSDDRSVLYVHAMFADDPEAVVRQLKTGMERMVREVFEA